MGKKIWFKLRGLLGQSKYIKYWVVACTFLVIMSFFDENNFFKRFSNQQEIQNLQDQLDYYEKYNASNREKINELQTNNANLEKFAREEHLMKRQNEDVFMIKEKD